MSARPQGSRSALLADFAARAQQFTARQKKDPSYFLDLEALLAPGVDLADVEWSALPPPCSGAKYATLTQGPEVAAFAFRLVPGGVIPHHDHRGFLGLMMVLEGEIFADYFDYAQDGQAVADASVALLPAGSAHLVSGRTSRVGPQRNIHRFIAGETGAVFVDLYTRTEPRGQSTFLDVEATASGDGYQARTILEIPI